ncbi:MAG: Asp-tRNA(Asn)/Glu-tRNA(Gln) amidotransferase subunit GatA [Patescibacteria group bacterium UBA2103]
MTSVTDIRKKLLAKEVTVADVVKAAQDKAKECKSYGAFLELYDNLDAQIAYAQKRLNEEGENAPALCGIPVAVKDNLLVKGRVATSASKILDGYVSPYNATVISKLEKDGAIFIGRTNMDEFAMGSSTEHSAYQKTLNPKDINRVPGGSSGGSATAVGLDIVPLAFGTDTGGSIRQPAAFCGIVGLKPTYGAVSRYGLMALGSSLDQIGPLSTDVAGAKMMFDAIKGVDEKDSTSREGVEVTVPDKMKIGVPRDLLKEGVDEDVLARFEESLLKLKEEGHEIVDITFDTAKYGIPVYYIVMPAEASANLARYDGVRFGPRVASDNFNDSFKQTRTEGFGEETRRRILLGTYVLSSGYIDAYYNSAERARDVMRKELDDIFAKVDVIATPSTATPAFSFGEKSDPLAMYAQDIFTVPANLTGNPGISVPMGEVERDGVSLPVGIQFVAPHFGEERLFTIGSAVTGEEYTK